MNANRHVLVSAVVTFAALIAGCVPGGVRHGWIMRGEVLAIDNGIATVCIGTRDGAQVGQVFDVQHITMKPAPPKGISPTIIRSNAGRVEIVDLFEEHYAHAKILVGSPTVNDVVELEVK